MTRFWCHSPIIDPNTFNPVWRWFTDEPDEILFWVSIVLPSVHKTVVVRDATNRWGLAFEIAVHVDWHKTQEAAMLLKLAWDESVHRYD